MTVIPDGVGRRSGIHPLLGFVLMMRPFFVEVLAAHIASLSVVDHKVRC
jgi:hypothetical protein